jgi:hypothetical protein
VQHHERVHCMQGFAVSTGIFFDMTGIYLKTCGSSIYTLSRSISERIIVL